LSLNTTYRFRRFVAPVLDLSQALVNRNVAENGKFKLGDWMVEPALDRISRGEVRLSLRPQVMDILVYLAHHRREVVSVDELLDRVWQGRVVTSASIYSALNQLREALGDDVHDAKYIKTIPRRGYRLIAEVEFQKLSEQKLLGFAPPDTGHSAPDSWPSIALVLALMAITAYLVFGFRMHEASDTVEPADATPLQSVAVLPFVDMSPAHDHGWFGDGMAEEILNKLAQVPGLKVSGRTSSFAFRGLETEARTIGRTLGVAHLLEGSVRRDGDHLRVTAQLIKASDGFHVWSQEYDRGVTEFLNIQDDIASNIARVLQLKLAPNHFSDGAAAAEGYYPDFSAYELYLKALELIHRRTGESLSGALVKLEKAIELEPEFAAAHLAMAKTYGYLYQSLTFYEGDGVEESRMRMRPHVEKALAIDPNLAEAYVIRTWCYDDDEENQASLRKAIALNPNLAIAYQELGGLMSTAEHSWEEAVLHMEKALELEPLSFDAAVMLVQFLQYLPHRMDDAWTIIRNLKQHHPDHPTVFWLEGEWLLGQGRLAEALPLLERAVVADPDNFMPRQMLNVAWFSLGETERAMEAPYWQRQWRLVLAPDVAESLRQMAEIQYTGSPMDFSNRALSAYIYLMLREWQSAVDVMNPHLDDPGEFRALCMEMMCGKRYSPALSLATAYHELGDIERYERYLAIEREAMNTRSENGRIHNFEYSRTSARVDALEGHGYEAMLELERLVATGPLDPRELMHPAFDTLHDDQQFIRLQVQQRSRVNEERAKMGLEPLADIAQPRLTQAAR